MSVVLFLFHLIKGYIKGWDQGEVVEVFPCKMHCFDGSVSLFSNVERFVTQS